MGHSSTGKWGNESGKSRPECYVQLPGIHLLQRHIRQRGIHTSERRQTTGAEIKALFANHIDGSFRISPLNHIQCKTFGCFCTNSFAIIICSRESGITLIVLVNNDEKGKILTLVATCGWGTSLIGLNPGFPPRLAANIDPSLTTPVTAGVFVSVHVSREGEPARQLVLRMG